MDLVTDILKGNKRAIARSITLIENESEKACKILKEIHIHTGNARIIGITGAPGSGKSSIVNALTGHLRTCNKRVGIIAVDPSSPFTGGALLGDRIRMQDLATDPGVFIRSMGSRGALGGLSSAAFDAAKVLDAAGMDFIIIETVGVGQSEIDIVKFADMVLLVLTPGMGDDVQAVKAGIMEIADIFVVNKSDKEGVERLISEIEMSLDLNSNDLPRPPVIKTVATAEIGIRDLAYAIEKGFESFLASNMLNERRRQRTKNELLSLVKKSYLSQVLKKLNYQIDEEVDHIMSGENDPHSSAKTIVEAIMRQ